ncbi:efflux RND transporter periplasmic adaptor subunit [Zavarzinella formosa]|uniref:efflux RND transporter periplasmic adaptor subunit n=1 Tax=Zavarzinella formosa TaxID=360055 RepID=UPI0002EB82C1|nr:efflux RND transporter periplasmic adaptor subunit [Zavarzinella formosa]
MRTRLMFGLLLLGITGIASLSSVGCAQKKEAPPAPPPPAVTVTKPVKFRVQKYLEYNGYLEAVETVQITARVKGFLNDIKFVEGTEVKKGDLLFQIDPREYDVNFKKANADKLKAMAELKRTRADEDRAKQLLATQALSMEDFQQRVASRETADAVLKQTEAAIDMAKLDLEYTQIHAPIDGQINRTLITRGNLVGQNENTLLTTIVGIEQLYVYFDVPERDLIEYQRGLRDQPESKSPTGAHPLFVGISTEQGYPHKGIIDFRENKVDSGTGTVRLRGRLENPKIPPGNVRLMYPGLYARVRIPMGDPEPQLVIPEDALMTGQEGRYVYVLNDENIVKKRRLKLGATIWRSPEKSDDLVHPWTLTDVKGPAKKDEPPKKDEPAKKDAPPKKEAPPSVRAVVSVEEGLKEGDRIVVNGLQRARPETPVTPEMAEFRGPAGDEPVKK